MAFRHGLTVFLMLLFTLCAFASSVLWIQWTTVVIFLGIMLLVDLMFLDDSAFVFDPDPVSATGFISVFAEPQEAVEFLTYKRGR